VGFPNKTHCFLVMCLGGLILDGSKRNLPGQSVAFHDVVLGLDRSSADFKVVGQRFAA